VTLDAEPECRARPRAARPEDVLAAVPLIVSSGPVAIDYGFATARHAGAAFVASAYARGEGLFGWKNHTVALWRDEVVGIAAGYGAAACRRMNREHAWQVLRHYGALAALGVLHRCLHLRSLMPAPPPGVHYVAHLGVRADLQGRGIGRQMLQQQCALAAERGCRLLALDVSVHNPRARALYERCGLTVQGRNAFTGPSGRVADTWRMTRPV